MECGKSTCSRNYVKHKDKILKNVKDYYVGNSEKIKEYQVHYRKKKDKRILINKRHSLRYRTEPDYKAVCIMRGHLTKLITRYDVPGKKELKSMKVGYSPSDLVKHLESLFKPGMTWSNHGEWHIDHIIPVSIFIKWGIVDPKIINALDNLQPLWAEQNLTKGNRYIG